MKNVFFILFLFLSGKLFSQGDSIPHEPQNPCTCCDYSLTTEADNREFEKKFPPEIIVKNKIKEVTIYTVARKGKVTARDTNSIVIKKPLFPEYKELRFYFNAKGYIVKLLDYYDGKPSNFIVFERNTKNKIIKETFNYSDSTEKIVQSKMFPPQIKDYTFDAKGNLVKVKERDYNGVVLADDKSQYRLYEYDSKKKITKEIYHTYYDFQKPASSKSETTITYSQDGLSSETKRKNETGKLSLVAKATYDKLGNPLTLKTYSYPSNKQIFDEKYEYLKDGKLSVYTIKNLQEGPGECPDYGGYTNKYEYDPTGLLKSILHSYKDISCEMWFEYK